MKKLLLLTSLALTPVLTFGISAADQADNAAYGGGWNDGTNGGTGFGAWDLTDNNNNGTTEFAGYFLGDSTAGAGDINTGGQSFGIYANPGTAFAVASRAFSAPFALGDQFTVQLAVNFDNGNKGFNLFSGVETIFGFNVGSGANVNTNFTDNPTLSQYDYGGAAVIDINLFYFVGGLEYTVSRTSPEGFQGTLFSGQITGSFAAPNGLAIYNTNTVDGSAQNNIYVNNLAVSNVPEPSTYAALLGAAVLAMAWARRRR